MAHDFLRLTNNKFVNLQQVTCAIITDKKAEIYCNGSDKPIVLQFESDSEAKSAMKKFANISKKVVPPERG